MKGGAVGNQYCRPGRLVGQAMDGQNGHTRAHSVCLLASSHDNYLMVSTSNNIILNSVHTLTSTQLKSTSGKLSFSCLNSSLMLKY